jgi:hypothetical protein
MRAIKIVCSFVMNPVGFLLNFWFTVESKIGKELSPDWMISLGDKICSRDGIQDDCMF